MRYRVLALFLCSMTFGIAMRGAAEPRSATGERETISNDLGMEFVKISAGSFRMGSDNGFDDEVPEHRVTLTKPFYLAVTEVTQDQYEAVMGENPSQNRGSGDLPVDTVPWDKAVEFCRKLSQQDALEYRLPTEAEWEYACRAGGRGEFGAGDGGVAISQENIEEFAWLRENSKSSSAVGRKRPNAWGLYDMQGNVFEWCLDNWSPYTKKPAVNPRAESKGRKGDWYVLRGSSWEWGVDYARAAARCRCKKTLRSRTVGFRVVAMQSETAGRR